MTPTLTRALGSMLFFALARCTSGHDAVNPHAIHADLTAENRERSLRLAFDGAGMKVSSLSVAPAARIALRCVGREHDRCEAVPIDAAFHVNGSRLEYARGPVLEWYLNGPRGVEQGFLLQERPSGSGAVVLRIGVEGLEPVAVPAEHAVLLTAESTAVLRVDEMHAFDATGRELESSMEVSNGAIVLRVNDRDARYPLRVDPLYGAEPIKLLSPTVKASEGFGVAAAVSGATAVIGTNDERAHVFTRGATTWGPQATLTTGAPGEFFGQSVAISGDTAIVGAYLANVAGASQAGAVYVFVRTGTTWTQQAKLVAADGAAGDFFGITLALDGDTAVVGARKTGVGGSVYVFKRTGAAWSQQQKLMGSGVVSSDGFAASVAVSGDSVIVGAPDTASSSGVAYVFVRSGSTWSEQQRLVTTTTAGNLGASVALAGDSALVGAPFSSLKATRAGAALLFSRSGVTWTLAQTLTASDAASYDSFGCGVAMTADTALIGACGASAVGMVNSGAIYVSARSGTTWAEQTKLFPKDGVANDYFGRTLAISGTSVVGGIPTARVDATTFAGVVHTYRLMPTRAAAEACKEDGECTSGHCAVGICCDRACNGPCEACVAALKVGGVDGTCGPIKADTDPKDACASGSGTCAADGLCDGASGCRSFAKPGTPCGPTLCSTGSMTAKVCKGDTGDCIDTTTTCDPYVCEGVACKKTCASNVDCAAKFRCVAGACEPTTDLCSADGLESIAGATGAKTACRPLRCDTTSGRCLALCSSEADCQPGFRCSSAGVCAQPPPTPDDPSCGVGDPRGTRGRSWLIVLAALVLLGRRASMKR